MLCKLIVSVAGLSNRDEYGWDGSRAVRTDVMLYTKLLAHIYIYILYINAEINRRFIRPIDCPLSRSRT